MKKIILLLILSSYIAHANLADSIYYCKSFTVVTIVDGEVANATSNDYVHNIFMVSKDGTMLTKIRDDKAITSSLFRYRETKTDGTTIMEAVNGLTQDNEQTSHTVHLHKNGKVKEIFENANYIYQCQYFKSNFDYRCATSKQYRIYYFKKECKGISILNTSH